MLKNRNSIFAGNMETIQISGLGAGETDTGSYGEKESRFRIKLLLKYMRAVPDPRCGRFSCGKDDNTQEP